jgi:hypothetical protein
MTDEVVVPIDVKKKEEKPRMLAPKEDIITLQIPVGELMKVKKFKAFDAMRQEANRVIGKMRNTWFDYALMKHGVYIIYEEKNKREITDIYNRHNISIVNIAGVDRIYKEKTLIGEWDRERTVYLNDDGLLMIEVQYYTL